MLGAHKKPHRIFFCGVSIEEDELRIRERKYFYLLLWL